MIAHGERQTKLLLSHNSKSREFRSKHFDTTTTLTSKARNNAIGRHKSISVGKIRPRCGNTGQYDRESYCPNVQTDKRAFNYNIIMATFGVRWPADMTQCRHMGDGQERIWRELCNTQQPQPTTTTGRSRPLKADAIIIIIVLDFDMLGTSDSCWIPSHPTRGSPLLICLESDTTWITTRTT